MDKGNPLSKFGKLSKGYNTKEKTDRSQKNQQKSGRFSIHIEKKDICIFFGGAFPKAPEPQQKG